MFQTIVVGVDGSAGARHAFEWAARLASETGAELVAVYCYSWSPMLGDATNRELVEDHRRQMDQEWTAGLVDGPTIRCRVEVGDPRSQLATVASDEGADLVVVGTRGHGPVSEMLLGSVAQWITHHAPVPVVVVPATAETPSS